MSNIKVGFDYNLLRTGKVKKVQLTKVWWLIQSLNQAKILQTRSTIA
jgi:hypothetical protein